MARPQKRTNNDDMNNLKEDAQDTMEEGTEYVARKGRQARRAAEDMFENSSLDDMAESAGRMARDAYDKVDELESRVGEKIRKHPLAAAGGAFLAGLIISRIFRS